MLMQWQPTSTSGSAGEYERFGRSAVGRRCTWPSTGLGSIYISQLEHGKKEPGLRTIEILAISFEMTPAQLLRGIHV
jgi:hypothetical protein